MKRLKKYCSRCKLTKSAKEFGKSKNTKDGLACWCKSCNRLYALMYRNRPSQRQARYGLKKGDYEKLWKQQNGKCAICGRLENELKRPLVIDHDHITNQVRGLLCDKCNQLLGYAWDNPIILRKAIDYLASNDKIDVQLLQIEPVGDFSKK